jgi:membrane-bound lytic murein transglycosylase A
MPAPVPTRSVLNMDAVDFSALQGWNGSDTRAALAAFRRSCVDILNKAADASLGGAGYAGTVLDWRDGCQAAFFADIQNLNATRQFFENYFVPVRLSYAGADGFFTGYYEPVLRGSRTRHGPFQTPIYGVPSDLVKIDGAVFRDTAAGDPLFERMMLSVMMMRYVPYPTRAEIEREGIPAQPLVYVDDTIDAFFLQIQGSGRVALDDGTEVRAAYAGQNGQPYTAIGSILLERGELTHEELSLQSIRTWLISHPDQAQEIMDANESYIFFSEQPLGEPGVGADGAEGVALTPGASLAVDLSIHALGVPVWLEGMAPNPDPDKPDQDFDRLLIAQDTGGAIRGALRGDVYWGIGGEAGSIAGRMKHSARMTVLLPKAVAARVLRRGEIPVS